MFPVCFQALGSDSEESKKVNVEKDVDQDITDGSGSNKNNLLGVLNVGFTALQVWDYSCH